MYSSPNINLNLTFVYRFRAGDFKGVIDFKEVLILCF